MTPIKSSLARSVGKLLGVYKDTDLSLRGDVQSSRLKPGVVVASGGNIDGATPGNGFKYHVFTSSGSLVLDSSSIPVSVEYLVVAGGGSGAYDRGGGGGAGGLRSNSPTCPAPRRTPTLTLSSGTTYPVTVGSGGITHSAYGSPSDLKGGNSSISTTVIASGGGAVSGPLRDGGSGFGGGSGGQDGAGDTVASPDSLSPTVQGFDGGGIESDPVSPNNGSGGGGGAGGPGGGSDPPSTGNAGVGGPGLAIPGFAGPLFPTMPTPWKNAVGPTGLYAGGGGGAGSQDSQGPPNGGAGGPGGGGAGGTGPGADGTAGVTNTGGGGGGGNNLPQGDGAAGGSGIVIIRYAV